MNNPLAGKRVVVTRAQRQSGELTRMLIERGAVPLAYPCIEIAPATDLRALDLAIEALLRGDFDWLVLTSTNTVRQLAERIAVRGMAMPAPPPFATAVVGPATSEAARRALGLTPVAMPAIYQAVHLVEMMAVKPGQSVFLPQSAIAPPALADALSRLGAVVTTVTAYRTITGSGGIDLPAELAANAVDAVLFTSASTVNSFVIRMTRERGDPFLPDGIPVVCIGPGTLQAAIANGFRNPIAPREQTLNGVIATLEATLTATSEGIRL